MRPSSEFEAEIEEYTHREKTALFVARAAINSYNDENGEVTGYVRTREKPTDNPNTLHIEGIFMRQDGSSHSSGRELVRFVLKHAEARGLTAVQVDTYPKSVPMHQLLKSMDFKKVTIGERELYTQQLKKT
jgi:ribosomal protein S18 acetylase RimI-like enzyme